MPREQLYQKYAKYYDKIYADFPYEEQAELVEDDVTLLSSSKFR